MCTHVQVSPITDGRVLKLLSFRQFRNSESETREVLMLRFHKVILLALAIVFASGLFSVMNAAQKGSENKGRFYFRQTCKGCHTKGAVGGVVTPYAPVRQPGRERQGMNRRKFLTFSAGGAATAAVTASLAYMKPFSHSPAKEAERLEIPTTCEMCVNKCSVIAVVENGVIRK